MKKRWKGMKNKGRGEGANAAWAKAMIGKVVDVKGRKFKVRELLGDGGYSVVYRVKEEGTKKTFAMKRMVLRSQDLPIVKQEIKLMKSLPPHKNIVQFECAEIVLPKDKKKGEGEIEANIVMEFVQLRLMDIMRSKHREGGYFSELQVVTVLRDVCEAVMLLHSQTPAIAHRDIKAENVLVDSNGVYKLCDFGSATTKVHHPLTQPERELAQEDIERNTTLVYRAPEMLDLYSSVPITEKVDIWALGCLMYRLCYFEDAFDDGAKLSIINANYTFPEFPQYSSHMLEFIRFLLAPDASQRPSISWVVQRLKKLRNSLNPEDSIPAPPEKRSRTWNGEEKKDKRNKEKGKEQLQPKSSSLKKSKSKDKTKSSLHSAPQKKPATSERRKRGNRQQENQPRHSGDGESLSRDTDSESAEESTTPPSSPSPRYRVRRRLATENPRHLSHTQGSSISRTFDSLPPRRFRGGSSTSGGSGDSSSADEDQLSEPGFTIIKEGDPPTNTPHKTTADDDSGSGEPTPRKRRSHTTEEVTGGKTPEMSHTGGKRMDGLNASVGGGKGAGTATPNNHSPALAKKELREKLSNSDRMHHREGLNRSYHSSQLRHDSSAAVGNESAGNNDVCSSSSARISPEMREDSFSSIRSVASSAILDDDNSFAHVAALPKAPTATDASSLVSTNSPSLTSGSPPSPSRRPSISSSSSSSNSSSAPTPVNVSSATAAGGTTVAATPMHRRTSSRSGSTAGTPPSSPRNNNNNKMKLKKALNNAKRFKDKSRSMEEELTYETMMKLIDQEKKGGSNRIHDDSELGRSSPGKTHSNSQNAGTTTTTPAAAVDGDSEDYVIEEVAGEDGEIVRSRRKKEATGRKKKRRSRRFSKGYSPEQLTVSSPTDAIPPIMTAPSSSSVTATASTMSATVVTEEDTPISPGGSGAAGGDGISIGRDHLNSNGSTTAGGAGRTPAVTVGGATPATNFKQIQQFMDTSLLLHAVFPPQDQQDSNFVQKCEYLGRCALAKGRKIWAGQGWLSSINDLLAWNTFGVTNKLYSYLLANNRLLEEDFKECLRCLVTLHRVLLRASPPILVESYNQLLWYQDLRRSWALQKTEAKDELTRTQAYLIELFLLFLERKLTFHHRHPNFEGNHSLQTHYAELRRNGSGLELIVDHDAAFSELRDLMEVHQAILDLAQLVFLPGRGADEIDDCELECLPSLINESYAIYTISTYLLVKLRVFGIDKEKPLMFKELKHTFGNRFLTTSRFYSNVSIRTTLLRRSIPILPEKKPKLSPSFNIHALDFPSSLNPLFVRKPALLRLRGKGKESDRTDASTAGWKEWKRGKKEREKQEREEKKREKEREKRERKGLKKREKKGTKTKALHKYIDRKEMKRELKKEMMKEWEEEYLDEDAPHIKTDIGSPDTLRTGVIDNPLVGLDDHDEDSDADLPPSVPSGGASGGGPGAGSEATTSESLRGSLTTIIKNNPMMSDTSDEETANQEIESKHHIIHRRQQEWKRESSPAVGGELHQTPTIITTSEDKRQQLHQPQPGRGSMDTKRLESSPNRTKALKRTHSRSYSYGGQSVGVAVHPAAGGGVAGGGPSLHNHKAGGAGSMVLSSDPSYHNPHHPHHHSHHHSHTDAFPPQLAAGQVHLGDSNTGRHYMLRPSELGGWTLPSAHSQEAIGASPKKEIVWNPFADHDYSL
ncbi:BMP-2-inducible protein kinase [Balamuthia mandrillaris]